ELDVVNEFSEINKILQEESDLQKNQIRNLKETNNFQKDQIRNLKKTNTF
ncbi:5325_t:CDS:1, partial [Scutellospora calospora]